MEHCEICGYETDSKVNDKPNCLTGVCMKVANDAANSASEALKKADLGLPLTRQECKKIIEAGYKMHIDDFKDKQPVFNTTVEAKIKNWPKFASLIENQFKHGGYKYKLQGFDDREATDVISAIFGGETQEEWILGNVTKYILRYKNFRREKDLLKIATYCYLLWLKAGHHLNEKHDEDTAKEGK